MDDNILTKPFCIVYINRVIFIEHRGDGGRVHVAPQCMGAEFDTAEEMDDYIAENGLVRQELAE